MAATVILFMSCRHWCKGVQGLVGTMQVCKVCPSTEDGRTRLVVGEASPYQVHVYEIGDAPTPAAV